MRANISIRAIHKERRLARRMMITVTTQKERKSENQNFAKVSGNLSELRIGKVL